LEMRRTVAGPSPASLEIAATHPADVSLAPLLMQVLDMVNEKKRHSKTAFMMLRYLCFIAVYIAVIIIQRNAWDAESMYTALMLYFNGKFRDEENLEMLDFSSTSTPGEIWGWIENMLLGYFPPGRAPSLRCTFMAVASSSSSSSSTTKTTTIILMMIIIIIIITTTTKQHQQQLQLRGAARKRARV